MIGLFMSVASLRQDARGPGRWGGCGAVPPILDFGEIASVYRRGRRRREEAMRIGFLAGAVALALLPASLRAEGERAGDFDYYVLSLSWTPTWCALEGDDRNSPQCDPGQGFGFTLHGLWPQYEDGWPSFCPTALRPPSRGQTGAMADIMGSSGTRLAPVAQARGLQRPVVRGLLRPVAAGL
jgi:hypothetical protein